MVASKQVFPLVRWAVVVCSYHDRGTRGIARGITLQRSPHNAPPTGENMNNKRQNRIRQADVVAALRAGFFLVRNEPERRAVVVVVVAFRCTGVPMKGNIMTNQNQSGQQNQTPAPKPGQQQGGGQKPGQQRQAPAKDDPKVPNDQTSDTDT
jgi:hypothetical protein